MTNNPFSLTFTLKQHTPLIHFHEHEGATLRATELKPKLDKWLIKARGGWSNVPFSWKMKSTGEEVLKSLNYKVIIVHKEKVNISHIEKSKNITQFFGNMGDDYDEHPKYLSETGLVDLSLVFSDVSFKKYVENQFSLFIARTNFGGRQNKGFGSFFLHGTAIRQYLPDTPYMEFVLQNNRNKEPWEDILNVVNYYYQRLKSGVNYCYEHRFDARKNFSHYEPSFLKIYFSNNNNGNIWEKRWIKEQFLGLAPNNDNKFFARAFLGLPYKFQFIPKRGSCNPNARTEVYPTSKLDISIVDPTKSIARVKSPITFKPVIEGGTAKIYIIAEDYPQPTNRMFRFSSRNRTVDLPAPPNPIDIANLINDYHAHLGQNFTAFTFTGFPNYQITLHP